jgi:hypothetical protein
MNVGLGDLPDNRLRVQVELEWGDETFVGMAEEAWHDSAEFVCAADATCRALEAVVAETHAKFEALQSEGVRAVGRMLAVVAVEIKTPNVNQYTVGVCAINDDPVSATVRAILSATNRRMAQLLGR